MSSLAGALASPEPVQPVLSPKPEDDAQDIMDDIKPAFASSPNEDSKDEDEEELHDLFGEDEDVNMVEHEPASAATSEHPDQDDGLSSPERRHREQMEYAEEEEPEPVVEHRLEADVAIPNIPVPRSSDGAYWVIRIPNFIKVDSKPFHPDSYVGPEHEDEDGHNLESIREKSMSIKLKVENTVRWRWTKDQYGQDRRQSNSRIVRWSDGSLSLQLGKELFDITQSVDNSGAMPRQALGGAHSTQPPLSQSQSQALPPPHSQSQSQSQSQSGTGLTQGQGLTYLVAQHKRAEILQCEALVTGYMSLRPTGMQSETHRMLVRAVGQKHTRVARLRMAPEPTTDPERERLELEKAAARKPRKSRGYGGGGGSSGFGDDDGFGFGGGNNSARRRRSGYARKRTGDDMWSDDDDDDDDGGFGHGGSEDDYVDFGGDSSGRRRGSGSSSKRKKPADDAGRKGPGEYQTDDFLVADTDEDDDFGEEASSRRKRRRASRAAARDEGEDEDGAGEDDLERLEARISQNEAAERKRRQREGAAAHDRHDDTDHAASPAAKDGGAGGADEDAMDVESEEEEDDDDFAHRRARTASGPRKRRALGLDDEDDEE